MKISNIDRVTY